MPEPVTLQPSILVLRRMPAPPQMQFGDYRGSSPGPGFKVIPYVVNTEPSFRIHLDGKKIGTIAVSAKSGWEKSSSFAIQAGHHNLFLRTGWLSSLSTPTLPFDIAPGETVTFLCQYTWDRDERKRFVANHPNTAELFSGLDALTPWDKPMIRLIPWGEFVNEFVNRLV